MPFNFQDSGFISRNGKHTTVQSEHAISSSFRRSFFVNPKTNPKRMEAKIILTALSWIGVGTYIGGILLNLGNWKSAILFGLGVAFMLVKLARALIKTYQEFKREEIEQQILKKKAKND